MSFDPARLCPTVVGYSYRTDAGLVRTPMTDGVIRQRRQWITARQELTLRFVLSREEVIAAQAFISSVAADWWSLPLARDPGQPAALTIVRLLADPQIKLLAGSPYFEYLLSVETQGAALTGSSS